MLLEGHMTLARLVFPLVLFFSLISCSDDEQTVLSSQTLLPSSKSDLVATWQGTLSDVSFNVGRIDDSSLAFSKISCVFSIYPFEYQVQMTSSENDRVTTYTESGDWKWEADQPSVVVFYNEEENFNQTYEERGETRSTRFSATTSGHWSGGLEISNNFARMKIYVDNKDLGISKYREGAVFNLLKSTLQ
jgi:hypothetical protein